MPAVMPCCCCCCCILASGVLAASGFASPAANSSGVLRAWAPRCLAAFPESAFPEMPASHRPFPAPCLQPLAMVGVAALVIWRARQRRQPPGTRPYDKLMQLEQLLNDPLLGWWEVSRAVGWSYLNGTTLGWQEVVCGTEWIEWHSARLAGGGSEVM